MTYRKFLAALWLAFLSFFAGSSSWAQFPNDATFTTLSLAPFGTEGLTADQKRQSVYRRQRRHELSHLAH